MMNSMIKENGVTFKELEKNIYAWVCQIGREFTKEFLERQYKRTVLKKKIPALLKRVRAVSLIQKSLRTFLFFLPETGREKEIRNGSEKGGNGTRKRKISL